MDTKDFNPLIQHTTKESSPIEFAVAAILVIAFAVGAAVYQINGYVAKPVLRQCLTTADPLGCVKAVVGDDTL